MKIFEWRGNLGQQWAIKPLQTATAVHGRLEMGQRPVGHLS